MAGTGAAADGGTDRVTDLLEEVLVEVFYRVRDVKDLFRCAATCRRWLRLFTDPDFLRRTWPETDGARLRGLFLKGPDGEMRRIFMPRPESPPGLEECSRITSLVLDNRDERGLLASSRGFILRHIFTRRCCLPSYTDIVLCNPITGAIDKFAPPPGCRCLNVSVAGHAIFTPADGDLSREQRPPSTRQHSTFSQLLLIGNHQDDQRLNQHLHVYSGVTGRWSASVAIRHRSRLRMTGARAGVVHQGAAHWLYRNETVDASLPQDKRDLYMLVATAATGRVSMTKLPIQAARGGLPQMCVGREGSLWVACVHDMRVDVWTQQDDDEDRSSLAAWLHSQMFGNGKNWLLSQVIQMPSTVPANENFMSCKWFYFNKGAMMAVYGGKGVFILDLETKAMEKIMDLSDCAPSYGYYMCVPYEMDLPEFFLGQLGGLAIQREREMGWRWPW